MTQYRWMSSKPGKKVHIVAPGDRTFCKVENTGALTAARLDTTSETPPEDRLLCSICVQYHSSYLRQTERVARVTAIRASGESEDIRFARSKSFLSSNRWFELRYEILKTRGRRCECCGATPQDHVTIVVDHIKPRSMYPELALDPTNLQVLCNPCNRGKGNWDQTDWREPEAPVEQQITGDDTTSTH